MPAPVKLEVIAYAPTLFLNCRGCEAALGEAGLSKGVRKEQLSSGLPPDVQRQYDEVSGWVRRVLSRHGERVVVDLVDVASVRGFWKSLRHGIRRYPAVIVDGRERFAGTDLAAAEGAVERRLSRA
jgi:hypothetical protein